MGLLAAMLAVTGIFGMAAYSVSRRMKELGIRVALGARRTQVMSAAVGRPMVLLGVGSVVGLLAGVFASRLLGQIVYQANPRDPAGGGRRGADDGAAGRCGVRHSGPASACCRSIQTHAGRVRRRKGSSSKPSEVSIPLRMEIIYWSFQGLNTDTPVATTSLVLRVTRTRLC